MSLRLALKRSLDETTQLGKVVPSIKCSGKKKGGRKRRKASTVSSSSESSTDQQTTDNESSITSISPSSTTSNSSTTTLPTQFISSTISSSNTIETISPSTSTVQPPTTLLSSSTTTNPAQHIVPNLQGRGALSKHIKQGLQNQADTPSVDLRCSVLLTGADNRPVLCPGIITDVYHQVYSTQYKIVVEFDHKETLTLDYPCPERRIFLHKKTWQTSTLLAKQNNRDVRLSFSFLKSPPSTSSTISQVPSGRALTVSTASIQSSISSSTTPPLSDRELDAIVPTIPPMIMPDGCVVRQAIRHGRVLRVSISYSELTSSDHPSIDTPSTTYDIDADDNSGASTTTSSPTSSSPSNDVSTTTTVPDKEQLKMIQMSIMKSIKSAHTSSEGEPPKLFDVTQETISIRSDVDPDDIPDNLKHLDGYKQSSGRPDDYNVETACPLNESFYQGEDNFRDSVKHIKDINGIPIDWNTLSLPKRCRSLHNNKKLVVIIAYYQTTKERKSCRDLHSFRSRRSDGSNRSATPDFMRASLSEEIFSECAAMDMYPFPMPHGGSPLDVLTQENFDYVMKMWVKHVLNLLLNDPRVVIALCSKTTGVVFAKHVLNGSIKKLHKLYEENPDKFISAVLGKLVLNYHPESIYNLLYWIMMEIKCMTSDAFFTNVLKAVTEDDDVAPCTFAQGLLEDGNNSAVFAFIQAAHLQKCSWGGLSSSKKRNDAALTYLVHIEAGLTTEQALESIKYEMGDEYHSLAVGYLKFCWMVKLAGQLQREEEIDMVEVVEFTSLVGMEVDDLMKNAEACRKGSAVGRAKGQVKFTVMCQLSAMMLLGTVDDDVVTEMAARCGMKNDDLLKNAETFKEGRADGQAKGIATIVKKGRVSWETMFAELILYKDEVGHCKVPQNYEANKKLGRWVDKQRQEYKLFMEGKKAKISEERIGKLNSIDFKWKMLERTDWETRFDQLVEYKKLKGDCNVPQRYEANPQLANWVDAQRAMSKKGVKSKKELERIDKLDGIEFDWNPSQGCKTDIK